MLSRERVRGIESESGIVFNILIMCYNKQYLIVVNKQMSCLGDYPDTFNIFTILLIFTINLSTYI